MGMHSLMCVGDDTFMCNKIGFGRQILWVHNQSILYFMKLSETLYKKETVNVGNSGRKIAF